MAVYTTDAEGRITQYNETAAELWGRRPELGKDLWCGSFILYHLDGTPMAHDECPMAITLKENRPVRGAAAIAERPDGTRVYFMPFPTPLRDATGKLIGAVNVLVDITDRKRAEDARREAEGRYRGIFESAIFGLFRTTAEGRLITANQALVRMFGYDSVEELTANIPDISRHLMIDAERRAAFLETLRATGEAAGLEARARRKDGSLIWISLAARPALDDSGKIIAYDGVFEDVTDRKRAENALRASEERFSKAFRASPAAMCIVRAGDRRFIDVNDAFTRMLGYAKEELIGRDAVAFDLWADEGDRVRVGQALLEKGEMRNEEARLKTRSGEERWVVGSADAITLDGDTCVILLVHDITDRIQAQQAQRRLKDDLARRLAEEQVINQISALLRTGLDLQTVCEAALDAVTNITGTEFGLIAARKDDGARLVASRNYRRREVLPYRRMNASTPSLLATALFKGIAVFSPEKKLPSITSAYFSSHGISRFAVLPLVAAGSIVGALQVASRNKGRWSAEQRRFLMRVADQLAPAVASALQYEQLEQSFHKRDEGVRAIAHEIRTPLTAIKGFAQLALRQFGREDFNREQVLDSLQEINTASERLTELAVHMLNSSSIEDSLSRLKKEECVLGPFLRDAIRDFSSQELPTKVRLRRVPRIQLRFDQQFVRQVLWNLLSNAIRHSPEGGEVVVSAVAEAGKATIRVSDSGPGVPPREQRRLFEKFYRGRNGYEDRGHKGLGLGLYLAQQVIEAHDGRIWYEETEPHGATFCFSLPL